MIQHLANRPKDIQELEDIVKDASTPSKIAALCESAAK